MRIHRRFATHLSLTTFIITSILFLRAPAGRVQASEYEELAQNYFIDRSVEYAAELLLREEYLGVLYKCTVDEIKVRKAEGLQLSTLNSEFWNLEPAHFDRDDPALAAVGIAQRYQLWVNYEEKEFQRRHQVILDIRASLIENSNDQQKLRMFQRELEKAMKYYGRAEWEIATLLFDRLLKDFGYNQVDDLLYYQSEACLQLKYYDASLGYLATLLSQSPDSKYRARAYNRSSELLQQMGMIRDQMRLYQDYSNEGFPGAAEEMGGVHLRAAQAEVSLGYFDTAIPILERVDIKSAHYLASRYFLADCYTALEEWSSAVDVLSEMVELKQRKLPYARWRLLTDEAKIKLAFIYYEWMEFDMAAELFDQLKSNSPFYDQVLMGKAWIAFQLDQYEEAIARTEELLNIYPRSTEIYEAGSLSGYCYEQLGQKSKAMTYFYEVLEAGVGRSKLQMFMKERRRIMDALAELEALGVKLLASGNEETYQQFKGARGQLILSLKRIGLAELLEANEGMKSLVAERILLDRLVQEQKGLEEQIESTENASLMADFIALEDRIYDIMERLKIAGNQKLKETPLYYQEAQVEHINTLADTLSLRVEEEIDRLVASIEATEALYNEALEGDETGKCLDYGLRLNQMQDILNRGYLHHVLAENSRRPVLKTRVDRWSDFSFSRYAMGGMEFDELERRYERLKQVEDYIATLDEMIEQAGAVEKAEEPVSPQEESPSETLEDQTE